jgi:hypothetical protein
MRPESHQGLNCYAGASKSPKSPRFYRHVIWTDICNSILPRSEGKDFDQRQARKGKRAWVSDDGKQYSRNLSGPKEALKQNSWDTERVWWAPVLTRGRLHIEVLPEDFAGDTPAGVAVLVSKLGGVLKQRFPSSALPRVVFTDRGRGTGFEHLGNSHGPA